MNTVLDIQAEFTPASSDHIRINGRVFQVSESPAWRQRPVGVAPLWLSEDASCVIEWALALPERDNKAIYGRRLDKETGESLYPAQSFLEWEAMDVFFGGEPSPERTAWWNSVKSELSAARFIHNFSWSGWQVTDLARTFFPKKSEPALRRMF